ncbi:hypothetical protein GCM10011613_24600 [Cellvibrio zantedeschiae]|uniref:Uncharacterized protein n=1 Tax=Cellvibrio zantedeschiae TaxID=1237077 RepID=A0ABQ3B4S5_9GAMM|nr:DUF6766 family protein [Cellvibrio zantedeschiae]GGY78913.1 hypothetical protein GCM10011613_24600 [Cellvibrio zantedeschiae]
MTKNHGFFKRNGLLIVFFLFMALSLIGQAYTGYKENQEERYEKQLVPLSFKEYLQSGHFIQSTFENWESEFLQMGMYVFFTVFLYQQGSAESKSLDEPEEVDREPTPHENAPWPVKKGGMYLTVYKNSLSLTFTALFLASFFFHAYGTMLEINEEEHKSLTLFQTLIENRFWFESLQNWQSEFLSVAAIVFFSIYLRQKGSPESKPVDAPHDETGK